MTLERGSTEHSPRVDEELDAEVESVDTLVVIDDVERRSLLATSLRPSAFPGDRDRLVEVAREEQADDVIVEWLGGLPGGLLFENVQSVWEALGGGHESRDDVTFDGSLDVPAEDAPSESGLPAASSRQPAPVRVEAATDEPSVVEANEPSLLTRVTGLAVGVAALAVGATVAVARAILRKR
jgi:hypothetical protein